MLRRKEQEDLAGQEDLLVYIQPEMAEDRFEALERFAEEIYKDKHPDEVCNWHIIIELKILIDC